MAKRDAWSLLPLLLTSASWAVDVPQAVPPAVTLEELSQRVAALEAQQPKRRAEQLIFMGFADLTWRADHDSQTNGNSNHFALGQFDLFVRRDIGEKGRFLGETVIETKDDGSTGVDLERAILSYRPFDGLEIGAGRYHTHLGWWNVNYHHGEWLQPTVGRPAGFAFEDGGGILPVHEVGLYGEHQIVLPAIDLRLVIEIGNGRGPAPDPPQVVADANDQKAVNLAFSLSPAALSGLEVGANAMFDRIPAFAGDPDFPAHGDLDELIIGVYGVLQRGPLQANLEALAVRHRDRASSKLAISRTGYAMIAWQFEQPQIGNLTPYVRADQLIVSDDDIYFASTDDRTDLHLGIRWDLTSSVAVKLQGTRSTYALANGERNHSTGAAVQVCGTY